MSGVGDRVWAEAGKRARRLGAACAFRSTLDGVERDVFDLVEGVVPRSKAAWPNVLDVLRRARRGGAAARLSGRADAADWNARIFAREAGWLDASWSRLTGKGHAALAYFRRPPKGWAP
jgi:hypothetical protein